MRTTVYVTVEEPDGYTYTEVMKLIDVPAYLEKRLIDGSMVTITR